MGAIKRELETISEQLGYGGEINNHVENEFNSRHNPVKPKLKKSMKVYAVNRLWKSDLNDIHFCIKHITCGPYKAKKLFTMEIPKGTEYLVSTDNTDYIFRFGTLVIPVQVKEIKDIIFMRWR